MEYQNSEYKNDKLLKSCITELKCPADCSGAGICDTSTGTCLCNLGRHGIDCSSKKVHKRYQLNTIF